jgi:hypothetical protein
MAFFATVPVLMAVAAGLVALAAGRDRPGLRLVVWTVGIAPGVLLLVSAGRTGLQGTGIPMGGIGAVCFAMAGLVALPLVTALRGRRAAWLPAAAAVLSVALVGAGLAVDRFDARYPEPTSLRYVLDADTGLARWESGDTAPHAWVRGYTPQPATPDPAAALLPYRATAEWTGPAVAVPFAAPELEVLDVVRDGDADTVRLRLRSARDADVVLLAADRPVEQVTTIADAGPPAVSAPGPSTPGSTWPFRLQFYDPPAEGVTVELRMADAAGLRLSVADYTASLDGLPGFTPRPAELTRSNHHDGDLAVVVRTYQL